MLHGQGHSDPRGQALNLMQPGGFSPLHCRAWSSCLPENASDDEGDCGPDLGATTHSQFANTAWKAQRTTEHGAFAVEVAVLSRETEPGRSLSRCLEDDAQMEYPETLNVMKEGNNPSLSLEDKQPARKVWTV